MAKRALLMKVAVQTYWVVIDDETDEVSEQADTGVMVPAADWPNFYERHCADFEAIKEAVKKEGETGPEANGHMPNRAQRRATPKRTQKTP